MQFVKQERREGDGGTGGQKGRDHATDVAVAEQ